MFIHLFCQFCLFCIGIVHSNHTLHWRYIQVWSRHWRKDRPTRIFTASQYYKVMVAWFWTYLPRGSEVLAMAVCSSVCLSVTSLRCIETAEHIELVLCYEQALNYHEPRCDKLHCMWSTLVRRLTLSSCLNRLSAQGLHSESRDIIAIEILTIIVKR